MPELESEDDSFFVVHYIAIVKILYLLFVLARIFHLFRLASEAAIERPRPTPSVLKSGLKILAITQIVNILDLYKKKRF